jgi:hypothetical protein
VKKHENPQRGQLVYFLKFEPSTVEYNLPLYLLSRFLKLVYLASALDYLSSYISLKPTTSPAFAYNLSHDLRGPCIMFRRSLAPSIRGG